MALVLLYLISSITTVILFMVTNGMRLKVSDSDQVDVKRMDTSHEISNPIGDGIAMVDLVTTPTVLHKSPAQFLEKSVYMEERMVYLEEREALLNRLAVMEAALQKITSEVSVPQS